MDYESVKCDIYVLFSTIPLLSGVFFLVMTTTLSPVKYT